jgi:hypothetical protein
VRASTQAHGPLRLVLSAMAVGILVILLMLFTQTSGSGTVQPLFGYGHTGPPTAEPPGYDPAATETPVPPTATPNFVQVFQSVAADTSVSSHPSSGGVSASEPVHASVTSPKGGLVLLTARAITALDPPSGFTFVGHQIEVVSPSGTAAAPIKISFEISTSLFEGDGEADVFRDGVLVPLCTGAAGVAAPDPCHETAVEGTGSIIVTVLTSQATSTWNFGEVVVVPPEPTAVPPTAVPPTAVPPEPKPATYFWLHNGRRIDLLPWW